MRLTNDPAAPGQPVSFKLQGFPEEAAVRMELERFYNANPAADRNFVINNMFNELIFDGTTDEQGKVVLLP